MKFSPVLLGVWINGKNIFSENLNYCMKNGRYTI